jgi:hypothetical protein
LRAAAALLVLAAGVAAAQQPLERMFSPVPAGGGAAGRSSGTARAETPQALPVPRDVQLVAGGEWRVCVPAATSTVHAQAHLHT